MHAEHTDKTEPNERPGRVSRYAFTVLNKLGERFREKVHENASAYEVRAPNTRLCLPLDIGKSRLNIKREAQEL